MTNQLQDGTVMTMIRHSDLKPSIPCSPRNSPSVRRHDRRDYRWLLTASMMLFLPVSVITRVLPRNFRPLAAPKGTRESCWAEARRAANAVLPYAFEW
ncbi:MAG: hypothetical protein AAF671_06720 [Pseudomonadota bacterium]